MSDEIDIRAEDPEQAALLAELRSLAGRVDPVPPEVLAAARSALAWRTMDAELAALVADSSVDLELAGVRSGTAPTLLTFDAPGLTLEVEILEVPGRRRLLGQLVPPGPGGIEVRHRGGTVKVRADEVGRFSADDVMPGPVSLRCGAGERVVDTDWFLA